MPQPHDARIPCSIIGCRRTVERAKHPGASEVICAKCGDLAKIERRIFRRAQRRFAKTLADNHYNAADRLWLHFKRRVTEATVGIG